MCIRDRAAAGQDTAAAEGQNTPAESDAEVQPASDITSDAVAVSYTHLDVYKRQEYSMIGLNPVLPLSE